MCVWIEKLAKTLEFDCKRKQLFVHQYELEIGKDKSKLQNTNCDMSLHWGKSVFSIVAIESSNNILSCIWQIYLQQKVRVVVNSNSLRLREKARF